MGNKWLCYSGTALSSRSPFCPGLHVRWDVSGYITMLAVAIVPSWLGNNSCISPNASGHRLVPEPEGEAAPTAGCSCAGYPGYPLHQMVLAGPARCHQEQPCPGAAEAQGGNGCCACVIPLLLLAVQLLSE